MSLLFLTTSKDCAHSAKLAHPTTKRQDHANLMQLVVSNLEEMLNSWMSLKMDNILENVLRIQGEFLALHE